MTGPFVPKRALAALATALASVLSAGCASPDPRYYTLAATDAAQPAPALSTAAPTTSPLWIEVSPVRVPERLNRAQMVVQEGDGSVALLDLSRWSAPLPDELRDALAQRLQRQLGAIDVYQQGQSNGDPVYRITTEVVRMDAQPGRRLGATINWTVRRLPDGAAVAGRTDADLPAPGGIEGIVAAMRQVVSDTATQIAAGVGALRR